MLGQYWIVVWGGNTKPFRCPIYGTVSASFVLEQTGFPRRQARPDNSKEMWNGVDIRGRLQAFTAKPKELSQYS